MQDGATMSPVPSHWLWVQTTQSSQGLAALLGMLTAPTFPIWYALDCKTFKKIDVQSVCIVLSIAIQRENAPLETICIPRVKTTFSQNYRLILPPVRLLKNAMIEYQQIWNITKVLFWVPVPHFISTLCLGSDYPKPTGADWHRSI